MHADASRWFADHTWHEPRWSVADLVRAKGSRSISVALPALNEAKTVAGVVGIVMPLVGTLVDECVVVDSGSTDDTIAVARAAGARVVRHRDILPDVPVRPGKGEVLWRALAATVGDILVFLDTDLVRPDPGFVPALLGPLLTGPGIHLVKGFYRRPIGIENTDADIDGDIDHDIDADSGGGRVTELLARPVLAALRPELSGVIQPLGGEYALTRAFAETVPFAAGYGVEIGLLLDAYQRYGLAGLAQVNLGVRRHRNRSLPELGVMARQILGTALTRRGVTEPDETTSFTQFTQVDGTWLAHDHDVCLADRPLLEVLVGRVGCADQVGRWSPAGR